MLYRNLGYCLWKDTIQGLLDRLKFGGNSKRMADLQNFPLQKQIKALLESMYRGLLDDLACSNQVTLGTGGPHMKRQKCLQEMNAVVLITIESHSIETRAVLHGRNASNSTMKYALLNQITKKVSRWSLILVGRIAGIHEDIVKPSERDDTFVNCTTRTYLSWRGFWKYSAEGGSSSQAVCPMVLMEHNTSTEVISSRMLVYGPLSHNPWMGCSKTRLSKIYIELLNQTSNIIMP
ncbi:hypothetical protein L210DRAFT_3503942 [Boletus edulis BED1]|uniref:Uncharacterized protein n=1 Tax=Boletus edulis BED1 TaxID=1328754 RepID=A0AAD4BV31_BOLED|nr:hypothetical protein L210DRAFT_3503942 [Boletus edulis BED1]